MTANEEWNAFPECGRVVTTVLLTPQQNSELLVVELHLVLGDQAALGALSHRVHETHARQHHLLAAALVAEAAAASPTVVLQREPRVGVSSTRKISKRREIYGHAEGQH